MRSSRKVVRLRQQSLDPAHIGSTIHAYHNERVEDPCYIHSCAEPTAKISIV